MRIWVNADLHLFHANLVNRGFRPADFQARLVQAWQAEVAADDLVLCLGDVALAPVAQEIEAHALVATLPGRHWLAVGNHDRRSKRWYLEHGWRAVADAFSLDCYGERVLLSHEPRMLGDHTLNVHGHFHNNQHRAGDGKYSHLNMTPTTHHLIVMEDVGYRPQALKTIIAQAQKGRRCA